MRCSIDRGRYPYRLYVAVDYVSDIRVKNIEWREEYNKIPVHGSCRGFVLPDALGCFGDRSVFQVTLVGYARSDVFCEVSFKMEDFPNGSPAGCEMDVEIEVDEYGKTDMWIRIPKIGFVFRKVFLTVNWIFQKYYGIEERVMHHCWYEAFHPELAKKKNDELPF